MEENKIYQNDNPKNGPLDGVQLRTDCVRPSSHRRDRKLAIHSSSHRQRQMYLQA